MKSVFLSLLAIINFDSFACTCIGISTIKGELLFSNVVIKGKVIGKNTKKVDEVFNFSVMEFIVIVNETYKGIEVRKNDTISVYTGLGKGDCGFNFTIGEEYIIYLRYEKLEFNNEEIERKYLWTDICTRTQISNKKEIKKIKRCLKKMNKISK